MHSRQHQQRHKTFNLSLAGKALLPEQANLPFQGLCFLFLSFHRAFSRHATSNYPFAFGLIRSQL